VEPANIAIIVLLLVIIIYMLYEVYARKPRRTLYHVRELLVCKRCSYRLERDFEPGDFIGLIKGKCPKCGGELKLQGIYAVELGKRER